MSKSRKLKLHTIIRSKQSNDIVIHLEVPWSPAVIDVVHQCIYSVFVDLLMRENIQYFAQESLEAILDCNNFYFLQLNMLS